MCAAPDRRECSQQLARPAAEARRGGRRRRRFRTEGPPRPQVTSCRRSTDSQSEIDFDDEEGEASTTATPFQTASRPAVSTMPLPVRPVAAPVQAIAGCQCCSGSQPSPPCASADTSRCAPCCGGTRDTGHRASTNAAAPIAASANCCGALAPTPHLPHRRRRHLRLHLRKPLLPLPVHPCRLQQLRHDLRPHRRHRYLLLQPRPALQRLLQLRCDLRPHRRYRQLLLRPRPVRQRLLLQLRHGLRPLRSWALQRQFRFRLQLLRLSRRPDRQRRRQLDPVSCSQRTRPTHQQAAPASSAGYSARQPCQ